ncbi:MAG: 2OG-Fe(II) oxygenase [Myxococcota bacterium]
MRLTDPEVSALGERSLFVRDGWLGRLAAVGVREALEALHREGAFHPAGMSRGAQHRIEREERGDVVTWLSPETRVPVLRALHDAFAELREALNRDAWLGVERFDVQLARYDEGARYANHLDAFPGGPNRRVTAIYYVNDGWAPAHGGRLVAEGVPIEPMADRLVVFLSERVRHEVEPALAPRYTATAWYYGP